MLQIRQAQSADMAQIASIYQAARKFMRHSGNPTQWGEDHPSVQLLEENIRSGDLYVCTDGAQIAGVFYFRIGDDPTYETIHHGQWLNDRPYGVIHHIAVAVHGKGVAGFCFDYALSRCPNLKIDTHEDNLPMQRCLAKNGFTRCGIIHIRNGEPRIAYQKTSSPSPPLIGEVSRQTP